MEDVTLHDPMVNHSKEAEEVVKVSFYEQIQIAVDSAQKHDILPVVMGDLNATVGCITTKDDFARQLVYRSSVG